MKPIDTIRHLVKQYARRQEHIELLALTIFTLACVVIALMVALWFLKSPFYCILGLIPLFFYRKKSLITRARELDTRLGLKGALVNSIQLSALPYDMKENYSRELIDAYVEKSLSVSNHTRPQMCVNRHSFYRSLNFGLVALMIVMIYPAFFPGRFWYALHHRIDYCIVPQRQSYEQGDEITLSLYLQGVYLPLKIRCVINQYTGNENWTLPVLDGAASYTFVTQQSFSYHFSFLDTITETNAVSIIQPMVINDLIFHLTYPQYTHLPEEEKSNRYLIVPQGTHAVIQGTVSQPCTLAHLIGADTIVLQCTGTRFEGEFTIRSSTVMTLSVKGAASVQEEITIYAIPDLAPLVDIYYPARDIMLPHDMEVFLGIRCSDDYGLARARFFYIFDDTVSSSLPVHRNALEDTIWYTWDLSPLNVLPGDEISYFVEVMDISGKRTRSKKFTVYFPTMEEIYHEIAATEDDMVQDLQDIQKEHTKKIDELSRIQQTLKKERELPWTDQERLKELIGNEEEFLNKVHEWQEELQQTIEQLEQGIVLDQESIRRLQEIAQLLEDIAPEELKRTLENIQQNLERNPQYMQQALEQLKQNQEELAKMLERTLELLRKYQQEVALQELAEMAEQLAQDAAKIDSLAQDTPIEELSDETEDLRQGIEELAQDMEELSNSQGLEEELAEVLKQLAMQAQSMAKMQPMDPTGTRQDLEQMSSELAQWYEQLTRGRAVELRRKLLALLDELIQISRAEEQIANDHAGNNVDPNEIDIEEQYQILQATRLAAESLYAHQSQSMYITNRMGKNMAKAVVNMDKVVSGQTGQRTMHVNESMRLINSVALDLLQNLEQATEGQGSSTGLDQFLQQLSSISMNQMMLNQSSFNMLPIPQLGLSAEQQAQISELAAQQRALRQSLEALQKEYGAADQQNLLDGVIEEMKETEEALYQYKIDRELIERQQKLMTRLLDAQKSIRSEEYGKQRKSTSGEDIVERPYPGPLPEEFDKDELRLLLQRALRDDYPDEYEIYIREYFKRLLESP